MPYALVLASHSMGSPMFLFLSLNLTFPLQVHSLQGYWLTPGILWPPFYLGYSPIELWDSLSGYVHPGIAYLVSQASDWLGAFWASLSGLHSSMTLVKLFMIGHCL